MALALPSIAHHIHAPRRPVDRWQWLTGEWQCWLVSPPDACLQTDRVEQPQRGWQSPLGDSSSSPSPPLCSVLCSSPVQIVLVTGANKTIGLEIVRQLSQQYPDWTLLLASRSVDNGQSALRELGSPANVQLIALDVTSAESVRAAAEEVRSKYGRLDILVNNAGVASQEGAIETNVYGVHRCVAAFLPLLSDGGRITIVSSEVGTWMHQLTPKETRQQVLEKATLQWTELDQLTKEYQANDPKTAHKFASRNTGNMLQDGAYGFSKTLVSTYGRQILARDLASRKITVVNCCPGFCQTDLGPHNRKMAKRTAADGAKSVVQALKRPFADTGKFFQDDVEYPFAQDIPEAYLQMFKAQAAQVAAAKQAQAK
jgi:NAD(P)-dependent dehydrogenase (short-subunit alcohol dehydrogenase family)